MKKALAVGVLVFLSGGGVVHADVFRLAPGVTSLETVLIGNPGSGDVSYYYKMGKHEVTAAQYAEFLNAKAKSDPHGLYPGPGAGDGHIPGQIQREGTEGHYTYRVAPEDANRPVTGVSYEDACRFVNWLANGQGDGDTETGTYLLDGYTGNAGNPPRRNPGSKWFLPSESEWCKAASCDPDDQAGNVCEWTEGGRLGGGSWCHGVQEARRGASAGDRPDDAEPHCPGTPPPAGFRIAGAVADLVGIPYLGPDRAEKADLYLPAAAAGGKRFPAVVIIHGGGWVSGLRYEKREINIGTDLALHGYVALSIDYLLASPEQAPTWPRNLHDCKTAVRWLRRNADRLHVDADHIGVIGGSAGGHLAAMVGVTGPEEGLDPDGPYGEFSCRVQAAVDLYGPADLLTWHDTPMLPGTRAEVPHLYLQASPGTHADQGDPPLLIVQGTDDTTVAVEQSEKLAAALAAAGAEHQLVILEGVGHSFHLQPEQCDLRPLIIGFFDKHLKPEPLRD